ncbi:Glycoside Hydrolase Family 30 protein [Gigaspora rosea]|uniref:Glycoside Hydrolase Family 30 protein n=1 Tax=Gigaspora rosea TaxID=44941 RepID=A0A397U7Z2_9GLOM|nr:Glycoside Hydrolase Family 30 protein [Gigaspora rosea]
MVSIFKILFPLTVSILLSFAKTIRIRTVFVDPNDRWQVVEGWGTSLAWWANKIGGYPDDIRNHIADLVFDVNKGLGLNVIRYNIGGGDNPDHNHMRPGGAVPGFLPCEICSYNWTTDANQKWILFAAQKRGANIFEAVSFSPPYWMTYSNCSSGSKHGTIDNLNVQYYDTFADYLTNIVEWFNNNGLIFRTLAPFNEPSSNWWKANGSQEGCHFACSTINRIIKQVGIYLKDKGLSNQTSISAADEYSTDSEVNIIKCIDSDAKLYISQYNTHAYHGKKSKELFHLSQLDGKRLWMSEFGLQVSQDMSASINLSEQILNDMRNLKSAAWVYWQAVDEVAVNSWGLIGVNYSDTNILKNNLGFYGFAQYTKFIRPGYQIITSNDHDTLAACSPDNQTIVLVCTNKNNITEVWNLNVSIFNINSFKAFRTSNNNETLTNLTIIPNITDGILTYFNPAYSITTWIFSLAIPI